MLKALAIKVKWLTHLSVFDHFVGFALKGLRCIFRPTQCFKFIVTTLGLQ